MRRKNSAIVNAAWVICMAFLAQACAHQQELLTPKKEVMPAYTWIHSQKTQKKGVAVLVHGLNLAPAAMTDLAHLFADEGIEVLRVSLSGHRGSLEEMRKIKRVIWEADFLEAYQEASQLAQRLQVPLIYSGFSLGGLLGPYMMSTHKIHFDKMVLLAPALIVRPLPQLIQVFNVFGAEFMLDSASPKEYMAGPKTSMNAFNALFEMRSEIKKQKYKGLNIPTLVIMDRQDELVSFSGISKLIRDYELTPWRIWEVKSIAAYHHVIIDQKSLGPAEWQKMEIEIMKHLAL